MKIFTKESAAFIVLAFIIWTILSILISCSVSADNEGLALQVAYVGPKLTQRVRAKQACLLCRTARKKRPRALSKKDRKLFPVLFIKGFDPRLEVRDIFL